MDKMRKAPDQCTFDLDKIILKLDKVVPSELGCIDDVVTEIIELVKATRFDDDIHKIDLTLREAMANAIQHGNRSDPEKAVRVCVAVQGDCGILIIVKDAGSGFDPAEVRDPLVGQNLLAPGGRGIFLINQLMDKVEFRFETGTEIYMRRQGPRKKSS